MNNKLNKILLNNNNDDEEIIDLKLLFESLIRNKSKIIITTFLFVIIGLFYLIFKPTWQGEFQIVLSDKKTQNISSQFLQLNSELANLLPLRNLDEDLNTQVEILKSPSVLMPTYIFVKNFKKEKGFKVNKWTYSDWFKENININLKRGTSV